MMDKRFVLLNPADNVFVCCQKVLRGTEVCIEGKDVTVEVDIDVGHKLARKDILKGEKIIKYAAPIGSATTAIHLGEHVHMHNIKSDYIASHTRNSRVENND